MTPEQPFRLPAGGLIDRSRPLSFTFDGRELAGFDGDTLASALLANGVRLVGRSFKYHRPRGILTAGSEEPNALVELRTGARREPNTRATTTELFDGLVAASQNRWPSLAVDVMSVTGRLAPMLPAGFYYKTFMWPAAFWERVYEPLIRRAAGLGRAAPAPDPDTYEKAFAFCDVLVVGAGAAGLAAALAASRAGARVILADEDRRPGGRLLSERHEIGDKAGTVWAEQVRTELAASPRVRIMPRTTVTTTLDHGTYSALERVSDHLPVPPSFEPRQRLWRIVARQCVLASGAHERPVVFGDNDRPGVMLAGAVRTYVNRYAIAPGRRLAIFAPAADAVRTAHDAIAAGLLVEVLVTPDELARQHQDALHKTGVRILDNAVVARAHGARGVTAVNVRQNARTITVPCDALAVSGGWSPAIQLTSHLGHRPRWNVDRSALLADRVPAGMHVAGAAAGDVTLTACLAGGARAGATAAEACGFKPATFDPPRTEDDAETAPAKVIWPVGGHGGKAFVDFQNDVTAGDIGLAAREGYRSVEHVKRYTTLGMATDQGKTANANALAVLAEARGADIATVGSTLSRPPYTPVAIGALAGHHRGKEFRPTRLTPTHAWAKEQGAVFVETGPWLRAQWYPRNGEHDWLESVSREVRATRTSVGVCDVSTLGKLEIEGPGACDLLERLYANGMRTLPVGKARYGLMLREDGHVLDDGTISRLAEHRYVVTTTTANAGKVFQHIELCRQVLWHDIDAIVIDIGEQWAQLSIAGPHARDVLRRVIDEQHAISDDALPYLAARELTALGGIPARLFRISFSGELAYEVAVPSGFGDALMRAIMVAGTEYGITPYGTEALGVMRIEKGHIAGNEINGTTTAADLGLGRMVSRKKDFVGRVMAMRPALVDPGRWRVVGLKPRDRNTRLRAGAHLLAESIAPTLEASEGYVTSVCFSPMLGHWIGLGLLARGEDRHGERMRACDPVRDGDTPIEICDPVFFDPDGGRLNG